jgi:hypothetical protein
MTENPLLPAGQAGLIAGSLLLAALTGCVTAGSGPSSRHPAHPVVAMQATLMIQDDYEYYPRYEIYYSRRRNEYVYRDANAWVRRGDLRGITLAMLESGPMVRMDFHDSPEFHHGRIVQSFPRNWEQSGQKHDGKNSQRKDPRDEKKGDQKDDDKKSGPHQN